jgi:acetyl-CoA carboxylase carboxyltransferase component
MIIGESLDLNSSEILENLNNFSFASKKYQYLYEQTESVGDLNKISEHKKSGKLTARERIAKILDLGSPFLEIGRFVGCELEDGTPPTAGIITGIGLVEGKFCALFANDRHVKGGTYFPLTVKKHLRLQQIALENNLPCFYLVDSGGAYLPLQSQVFPDRHHFGRIFYNQAQMSAKGIPQIGVVLGSCTAGGAYVPAMCDETVIVKRQGTVFLGGPPLVKAATGEEISAEELGGALVHTKISGVADYLAENDEDALIIARSLLFSFQLKSSTSYKEGVLSSYDPNELSCLIPKNPKTPLPMYQIIARIIDSSELVEFKKNFGTTLITGFAHIEGEPCGIIANNGILFPESALKATHFIQLCNRRNLPLIFLHDITGFMVGREYEHAGIAKAGAKMVTAVVGATVPKISIIVGKSFGAGNYGMCGRAYDPRFLFSWPNAEIGVMGGEQAVKVLLDIKRDKNKDESLLAEESLMSKYKKESSAFFSSANLWDDGIILPQNTRSVLGMCLKVTRQERDCLLNKSEKPYGIFRT